MTSTRVWGLAAVVALTLMSAAPATQSPSVPKLDRYKQQALPTSTACTTSRSRWSIRSSASASSDSRSSRPRRYLTGILEKEGFTIEKGIAGIPTAWTARFGSGKPVIALGSDVDCIPQASQKPGVAYRAPMIAGAPGHGEGHNSGVPLNITAAIAVKRIMQREKLSGTLVLWPGIAEELLGTKAYYVREGVFKDVDIVLYNHVGSNLGTGWGESGGNGLVSVEYNFDRRVGAQRGRAVARQERDGRRRADERRLELSPRASAHSAALALRRHQRRRSAQRRAEQRVGLVLLPRDVVRGHQEHVGDRRQHRQGRGDDDRHDGRARACSGRRGRRT